MLPSSPPVESEEHVVFWNSDVLDQSSVITRPMPGTLTMAVVWNETLVVTMGWVWEAATFGCFLSTLLGMHKCALCWIEEVTQDRRWPLRSGWGEKRLHLTLPLLMVILAKLQLRTSCMKVLSCSVSSDYLCVWPISSPVELPKSAGKVQTIQILFN